MRRPALDYAPVLRNGSAAIARLSKRVGQRVMRFPHAAGVRRGVGPDADGAAPHSVAPHGQHREHGNHQHHRDEEAARGPAPALREDTGGMRYGSRDAEHETGKGR